MTLLEELRRLLAEGPPERAWRLLHRLARSTDRYEEIQTLGRARHKLLAQGPPPGQFAEARVALLGGATTAMLAEPLLLALEAGGVRAELHASEFGSFALEMLEPSSATVAFRPDVAVVLTTPSDIPTWPAWDASAADVTSAVAEVCDFWLELCGALHQHAGCDIVLGNFHALPQRPLGTAGVKTAGEPNRFLAAVNEALALHAPPWLHLHDVAALAAYYGISRWIDQRFWYQARQPVSFECLAPYVRHLAGLIGALFGRSAKCVVLDLDNTLWGGVVGDDGPDGLVLGQGDPRGEAFLAFQQYLRQLRNRGVLLAVCSKNDESAALEPFARRPEMGLTREDFAVFRANWRPKSENLRAIAAELNLGLDALVFVDDNPAEREEVSQALPDVRVVDLGDDPADFPAHLEQTGWLDQVTISEEDRGRAVMYAAEAARRTVRTSLEDYEAYLRSLGQRAIIAAFEERHLDRIAQLTNKTNQFNLTTRRLSRSELAAMLASADHLTASVRLADRFGDQGLIAALAARGDGPDLWIDLWLMSCRVLNRGVEQLLCNHLVERARAAGYRTLHGHYRPTPRNGLVADLYGCLGFTQVGPLDDGIHWSLELASYTPRDTAITLMQDPLSPERTRRDRRGDLAASREPDAGDLRG